MRSFLVVAILLGGCGVLAAQSGANDPPPLYWAIANNDALEAWKLTDPAQVAAVVPEPEDLSWAVARGAGETFDVLTFRGAAANAILADGRNLLFPASEQGRLDLFRKIVLAGALLDQVDIRGFGLLHAGVLSIQPVMVNYLLTRGVAPVSRSDIGITPLMEACRGGRIDAIRTLLDWGANPDDEDFLGRSVLWYAQQSSDESAVALITSELAPAGGPDSGASADGVPPLVPEQTLPAVPSTPAPESQP